MSLWKLFRKPFGIALGSGLDADLGKVDKMAIDGELFKTSDTDRVFIATSTAGASDATKVEIGTLKGNADVVASSTAVDMTFNNKIVPVDATGGSRDFTFADGAIQAGFRCTFVVKNAANSIGFQRSGSVATVNGITTQVNFTSLAAGDHVFVSCGVDDEIFVANGAYAP